MLNLVLLLSLVLIPQQLLGQGTYEQKIELRVIAEVEATSVQLITIQEMDFTGINPEQRSLALDPLTSERAGKMVAMGDPGSSFRISFLRNRVFTNRQGTGGIEIEYRVSGFQLDEQGNADLIEEQSRELVFSEEGSFYFWIGGTVDLERAAPGTYEGEFTLEIEYL